GYSVCHQAQMPEVPDPESLPEEPERYKQLLQDPEVQPLVKSILKYQKRVKKNPMDVRVVLDSLNWSHGETGSEPTRDRRDAPDGSEYSRCFGRGWKRDHFGGHHVFIIVSN
ncbi:unnamed protein product, partial [Durusdinium trenchii]